MGKTGGNKSTNGLALAPRPTASDDPWTAAVRRVEEALGGLIEALLEPAMKGSLPHAKYLIEFAQAAKTESPSENGSGEIKKLLEDLLRDEPAAEPPA